jgi:two-component system cell cycle response regulator
MDTKTVVWVVPEGGLEAARSASAPLSPGFRIVQSTFRQAPAVAADLRILSYAAFPDGDTLVVEYGHDPRPTLILVDSTAQEDEVLQFIRNLDDTVRSDAPPAIIGRRLARLAARYDSSERGQERVRFDELTSLPSRRTFELTLRRVAASARSDGCRALLYLDLDEFKKVNDRFGHAAGQEVLIEVKRRLSQHRLPGQSLARIGGDAFIFFLFGDDRQSVREAAERIMRSISATPFRIGGEAVTITVSGGLAFVEPGLPLADIFRHADQAAYEAKVLGRNMLVVFEKSAFRKATEDPLTGLYNQGYFETKLLVEIKHADDYQAPLTIALCDLDHFGRINKRIGFGMPAGNAALKRFAEVTSACVRSSDWIARCGGDEFCLVMPGTTLEAAIPVAERVRAAVAAAELLSPTGERFSITVSIGVIEWSDLCRHPDRFMQKASDAVNAAKSAGGNRVLAANCEAKD